MLCLSAAARNQRPGWEARWGNEEPARVTGVAAGEIAVAGAAAGFATAGGLEEAPVSAKTDSGVDVIDPTVRLGAGDGPLADELPQDVAELQDLVGYVFAGQVLYMGGMRRDPVAQLHPLFVLMVFLKGGNYFR